MRPLDRFTTNLSREQGAWANALSKEQTAYALAQVSAANILPSLVELDTGYALLEYAVRLRDHMDRLVMNRWQIISAYLLQDAPKAIGVLRWLLRG